MKQFEKKSTITFRWWNDEKGIKESHILQLEHIAEKQISDMRKKCFTCGELSAVIDGVTYEGAWEFTYIPNNAAECKHNFIFNYDCFEDAVEINKDVMYIPVKCSLCNKEAFKVYKFNNFFI